MVNGKSRKIHKKHDIWAEGGSGNEGMREKMEKNERKEQKNLQIPIFFRNFVGLFVVESQKSKVKSLQ